MLYRTEQVLPKGKLCGEQVWRYSYLLNSGHANTRNEISIPKNVKYYEYTRQDHPVSAELVGTSLLNR